MKKVLLPFLLLALIISCGRRHKEEETVNPFDELKAKRTTYINLLKQNEDSIYPARCDKLTFKALVSAFSYQQDLSGHEYPSGKLNRDVQACYNVDLDGDGFSDSRSSISPDPIISMLHYWFSYGDEAQLTRFINYSEKHFFTVGEGPKEYTNIAFLMPILYKLQNALSNRSDLNLMVGVGEEDESFYDKYFTGYRSQLIANYIFLQGRMEKALTETEMLMLEKLYEENRNSPIIVALYHRFTDGEQGEVIDILSDPNLYPSDRLPDIDDGELGWGESPRLVHFLVAMAIIEGK